MPAMFSNTECFYALLGTLFSYVDNFPYAHDIFILIFIKSPLKCDVFIGKDEDNISPQSADFCEFIFIIGPQGLLCVQLRIPFVHGIL